MKSVYLTSTFAKYKHYSVKLTIKLSDCVTLV